MLRENFLFCLMHRICRVSAAKFLHSTLERIFGVFPVSILISVIKLIWQPYQVFFHTLEVFIHQPEHGRIKLSLFFIIQIFICTVAQNPEVMQTEAFTVQNFIFKFIILPIQPEKSFHIPFKCILNILTDKTAAILKSSPCTVSYTHLTLPTKRIV